MSHNSSDPNQNSNNDNKMDLKKYENNLIAGAVAVAIGVTYKGAMKKEIIPVTGIRKMVETFLVVTVSSILGTQIADKLRKDGYLKQ